MAKRRLSDEELAKVRRKLAKSALATQAGYLTPRDREVINNPDSFRIHVFGRGPNDRVETIVDTGIEAHRIVSQLPRGRVLVYAVQGTRSALVPASRYDELFLYPTPEKASKHKAVQR